MANPATSYQAQVEKTQYRGWTVYRLTNGIVSLYVAPDIGGRAIQMQLGDQEFFFVNPDLAGKVLPPEQNNVKTGWANYGGDKVWPAPEGWRGDNEWPSIPYYVLDGSKFASQVVTETPEEVAVRVTSPPDPRTGVQFERTFHVYAGTTRIKVDQVMRNISRREIRWGIWHLIQNDAADAHDPSKPNPALYMYIPLNPRSHYAEGYYKPYGDARHPSYELIDGGRMLQVHYLYRVGKAAADTDRGWYAVVNGQKNIGFVESFKYFAGAEYPDGASVETWNDGPGTISRGPFDQTLENDPTKTPFFLDRRATWAWSATTTCASASTGSRPRWGYAPCVGSPSIVISTASHEALTAPASSATPPHGSSGCTCAATTAAGASAASSRSASCSAPEG